MEIVILGRLQVGVQLSWESLLSLPLQLRFCDGSSNCCSIRPSGDSVRRRSDRDRPSSRDRASGVDDDTGVGGKMIVVISSSI